MELKSKREAAEFLGLSTRGIERAVRRGHLSVQYRDSKHGAKAWFRPFDLERYLDRKRAPVGFTPGVPPPHSPGAPAIGTLIPMVEIPRGKEKPSANLNPVPISERLTLNLREAAYLSGLPRKFLADNIRQGKLKALNIGRGCFVRRSDLNEFVRNL